MKTIKVTDEMYEDLMNISKELNTQDHRSTRMPYMIQVRKKVEVAAYSGGGEPIWVNEEGNILRNIQEVRNYLVSNGFHWDSRESIEDNLSYSDESWREVEVTEQDELSNFFFTEKGLRSYYGDDVDTFLTGVENPELETVMKFLCELSGGKLHT